MPHNKRNFTQQVEALIASPEPASQRDRCAAVAALIEECDATIDLADPRDVTRLADWILDGADEPQQSHISRQEAA